MLAHTFIFISHVPHCFNSLHPNAFIIIISCFGYIYVCVRARALPHLILGLQTESNLT